MNWEELFFNYGTHFTNGLNAVLDAYHPFESIDTTSLRMLDIGCGSAKEIPLIRSRLQHSVHFTAIDSDSSRIWPAQLANLDDSFYPMDAQEIVPRLPKNHYDSLLLFHPEMTKPIWPNLIAQASDCVRRGGLVLSTHFAANELDIIKKVLAEKGFSFLYAEQNKGLISKEFGTPHKYVSLSRK